MNTEKPIFIEDLPKKERELYWLNQAIEIIEHDLEISDLSTMEILQLKKYVEEAQSLRSYFKKKFLDTGDPLSYKLNTVQVLNEVLQRYLGFYGIEMHQVYYKGSANMAIKSIKEVREYVKKKLKQAREEMHKP